MKNKLLRKWDIIIILLVVIGSCVALYSRSVSSDDKLIAVITVNGEEAERINLDSVKERTEFSPKTTPKVLIVAEKGCIFFESADCKDKICVSSGKLTKKGDTAVCLPAKTVVSVIGANVDAVTW